MVTFLHTADWQIGITRRWLEPEAQARFDSDRIQAIRSLGRIARETDCAFVVVAGDVFESNQLRTRTVIRALEAMGEIALPVYLLPGNHDPLDAVSIYRQTTFVDACPANVTVLDDTGPYAVSDGVELLAAPWLGKHPERDLVGAAIAQAGPADGTVRIVVGHGVVDVLDPSGRHPAAIDTAALLGAIDRGQIHYVALGDRHSRTDVSGSGSIWYSGTMEVTDPREEAPGEVLVVQAVAGQTPRVATHRTGTWDFRVVCRDVNSAQDVVDLVGELSAITGKERVVLKLALQGTLRLPDYANLQQSLDSYRPVFAGLHDWGRHTDLAVLPDDQDWSELGLSGFVAEAADEIRGYVPGADEAGVNDPHAHAETDAHSDADLVGGAHESAAAIEEALSEGTTGVDAWTCDLDRADDGDSARDALALLYRLTSAGVS